jgi:endoglucanase
MRALTLAAAAVVAIAGVAAAEEKTPPKAGDLVFAADFEAADPLAAWPARAGAVRLDAGYHGGQALFVECGEGAGPAAAHVAAALPVERVRGCKLLFSAMVRAEGVSAKPNPWNGIKFMAPIDTPGSKIWPQGDIPVGTFDWRKIVWQTYVPQDATQLTLVLGLENVRGKAWFDDVRVTVRRPPLAAPPQPAQGPAYKGHTLPRLRGAMVSPDIDEDGLRTFGRDWNANLIRWQLGGFKPGMDTGDLAAYDAFLEAQLKKLDRALPLCEKYGLMVVVDLHTGPGHWAEPGRNLFTSAACQKRFVQIWDEIPRRYKNAKPVWGYDLLNEPLENGADESTADWQELAERAARAVRAVDPERCIIVEPAPGGGPEGLPGLLPLKVPNVVYSVHMYLPHVFTHQGVYDDGNKAVRYPGEIDGKMWDRAALEAALRPVTDFQRRYGVHVYIGEFSAIRWAPDSSACRYIKDCIDIFESHGWDWTYHAFREWQGWSAEHGPDKSDTARPASPPDREKLLREWFAKNQKPAWHKAP